MSRATSESKEKLTSVSPQGFTKLSGVIVLKRMNNVSVQEEVGGMRKSHKRKTLRNFCIKSNKTINFIHAGETNNSCLPVKLI